MRRFFSFLLFSLFSFCGLMGQRTYSRHSVLASGNWYQFSVDARGIYKLDMAFLAKMGIASASIPSQSIQLFGNGGQMLSEDPGGTYIDDLRENAIWLEDGGDGILSGSDYILFYAPGPQEWRWDASSHRYRHTKNLYSDRSFYYLRIGNAGKRIGTLPALVGPTTQTQQTDVYAFYELDSVNLLGSGKDWFGEEFSDQPGKLLTRQLSFPMALSPTSNVQWSLKLLSRSVGTPSKFQVSTNNLNLGTAIIPSVTNGAYDVMAQVQEVQYSLATLNGAPTLQLQYVPAAVGATGWLDWIEVQGKATLSMKGQSQLFFSDQQTISHTGLVQYQLSDADSVNFIWDVSDFQEPQRMILRRAGSIVTMVQETSRLHYFIACTAQQFLVPKAIGKINNQDLHGLPQKNYLIIAAPEIVPQAERLGAYHVQKNGLTYQVVTPQQIYHEFSSGVPDPTALRDFVKMFFDRAGSDSSMRPRYLLLFGDASYDYKNRFAPLTAMVPCYESAVSLDPLSTYTSDDFFGYLEDGDRLDGQSIPLLDIGIGRIPAANAAAAKIMVDKIMAYEMPAAMGPWKNELTFVADDEDANLFIQDAELITSNLQQTQPAFHTEKIYLDAFTQQASAAGSRYPDADLANRNKLMQGTLIWNYNGHGGYRRLAEEVVLDRDIISQLKNPNRLPLFLTATCDVAPYDNPLIQSIGEQLMLQPNIGAIALMTTTRLVFAYSNRILQKNYLDVLLKRKNDGSYPSLGEAAMRAKNYTYQYAGDITNNRKFTLLGDPALRLSIPTHQVIVDRINQKTSAHTDTLRSNDRCEVEGYLADVQGATLTNFTGTVYVAVYDKAAPIYTKGNDPASPVTSFLTQKHILFSGQASVKAGRFKLDFKVPLDIDQKLGMGSMLFYAENGQLEGKGVFNNFMIGGSGAISKDHEGPIVRAFLNDERFVNGGLTQEDPVLILKLSDSSGINRIGLGMGHDIQMQLDGDPQKVYILNDQYMADRDDPSKGTVRFQLPTLTEGQHLLTVKAWDNANNVGSATLDFTVSSAQQFRIDHVFNYPNPFSRETAFWFMHNRAGTSLGVHIQIFTVSGRLIKTLRNTIFSQGNRSDDMKWDGRDEFGGQVGRGVYIYKLQVTGEDGSVDTKWQKLYIL